MDYGPLHTAHGPRPAACLRAMSYGLWATGYGLWATGYDGLLMDNNLLALAFLLDILEFLLGRAVCSKCLTRTGKRAVLWFALFASCVYESACAPLQAGTQGGGASTREARRHRHGSTSKTENVQQRATAPAAYKAWYRCAAPVTYGRRLVGLMA